MNTKIDNIINSIDKLSKEETKIFFQKLLHNNNPNPTMDFKTMSENGLIWKINKEVLHKLGLALSRDINNFSLGCIIETKDFEWFYYDKSNERNQIKYDNFLENRIEILTKQIKKQGK